MQAITKLVTHGRTELAKVIVGQSELIDGTLTALLCGGHAFIEGVPGLGKTLSVKVLARALECDVSARAMYVGPHARRLARQQYSQSSERNVFPAPRVDVYRSSAGRRSEPHAPADPSVIAGIDGRAAGHDRRCTPFTLTIVHCAGHTESSGVRRHVPFARSATGSVPAED